MEKIFADTDIIIDLLTQREPFYLFAATIFSLAEKGKLEVYISSLCFNNVDYLLSKQFGRAASREVLRKLKLLVKVLAVDDRIITLALNSNFQDFEDAIQHYTAVQNGIQILVTRNLKDYKQATISVMSAETYLTALRKKK